MTGKMTMALLRLYSAIGKILGYRQMATRVVPSLLQILVDGAFNRKEYTEYCEVLNGILRFV